MVTPKDTTSAGPPLRTPRACTTSLRRGFGTETDRHAPNTAGSWQLAARLNAPPGRQPTRGTLWGDTHLITPRRHQCDQCNGSDAEHQSFDDAVNQDSTCWRRHRPLAHQNSPILLVAGHSRVLSCFLWRRIHLFLGQFNACSASPTAGLRRRAPTRQLLLSVCHHHD